jgi:hypothetical protein
MGFFALLKARPHSQEVDGQANVSKVPALQGRKASSISSQLHQVNRLPVDYPLRFSGPVTASPPAASGMASNPTSSSSPYTNV